VTGWSGPRGEEQELVLVDDVCPTCGQQLEDRHGTHREVASAPPRRWPLGLAAGVLVLVALIAVARQSGDDDPGSAAATSTTAADGEQGDAQDDASTSSTTSTTAARPTTTVRPAPTTSTTPPEPPRLTSGPGLPAELAGLSYVVGGRMAGDAWIVDLAGGAEPLWRGPSPPRSPVNVLDSTGGPVVVTEGASYLRGSDAMTRLPATTAWSRPLLSPEGIWQIRETSGLGSYGVLEHRSLDGRTLLEEVEMPTWGWVLGLLDGRPLLSSSGVASGTFRAGAEETFERVSEGAPLYYAAGRMVETYCDERLACQVRLVDLATGAVTPISDSAPVNDLQVVTTSADGTSIVLAAWDREDVPSVAVDMVSGRVVPLAPPAADAVRRTLRGAEWGPVGPTGTTLDPSGRFLLVTSDEGIDAIDLATGETTTIAVAGGTEVLAALTPRPEA
jgi:hypothetical protein